LLKPCWSKELAGNAAGSRRMWLQQLHVQPHQKLGS
jgi:hypothetical protein